jgi:hypothetical protein
MTANREDIPVSVGDWLTVRGKMNAPHCFAGCEQSVGIPFERM